MSSVKLSEDTRIDVAYTEQWIELRSPQEDRPLPSATGVVLAISSLRKRYRRGSAVNETVDLDDDSDYGSGDPGLAADIEEDVARRWDK